MGALGIILMPVTPFHLLAIAPVKALAPRKFSWIIFALTNVVIDFEPITYFVITLNPAHRFFHTIIGATLVAILCVVYGRGLCEKCIKHWNSDLKPNEVKWFSIEESISKFSAWSGGLIGAWSHIFLDSFMHDDIKPLSPFTDSNILLNTISMEMLHTLCIVSGVLGIAMLFVFKPQKTS